MKHILGIISAILIATANTLAQQQSPTTRSDDATLLKSFGKCDISVHDPSPIVKCNGEYWLFTTGANTPSFHSSDLTNWTRGPLANAMPPAWVKQAVPLNRGNDFWAPDVVKAGNNYMLFYAVSSFGKNISAIGVATNPTLDPNDPKFHWSDGGIAVQSHENDDFNALDPSALITSDGKMWLAFGSFWSGIKLIQLDPTTGHRITADSPMYNLADWDSIEAPLLYEHDGNYYLFVSFGMCCRGVNSTYYTAVGRAKNVTGPYLDKDGHDMLAGAGTVVAKADGVYVGPGQAGILEENGKFFFSCHYYDGTERGQSRLSIRPLTWSADGWPVVGTK